MVLFSVKTSMNARPAQPLVLPMPRVPTRQEATCVNAMIITMVMVWFVSHVVATLALQQAVQPRVPVCARLGTAVMLLLAVKTSMNATLASTLATRTVYALTLMVATTALVLPTSTGTGLPARPAGHTRLPRAAVWMPPPARVTSAILVMPPSGVQTSMNATLASTLATRTVYAPTLMAATIALVLPTSTGTGLPAQPVGHTRLPRAAVWMPPPARVTSAILVMPPPGVQTRTSVRSAATLLRRARTPPGAFLANARRTTTGTG
eukprot:Rmarinus@m.5259